MAHLFCKPSHTGTVFEKYISELSAKITIRSLQLRNDMQMLCNWITQPYARRFWQMDDDPSKLHNLYKAILKNPVAHSFIVSADEQPIALVDAYNISADELNDHIDAKPNDAGLHLLMGPPREMEKGYSFYTLKCFQEYFFSFETDADLYAEPDQENYHANRLAINTGFKFLETVQLSYKKANLYRITREGFSTK